MSNAGNFDDYRQDANSQDDYLDDDHLDDDICNDIAIIGMAGRFPMAQDIDEFWTNLVSSQDCISRFSREQLLAMGVDPATLDDPNYVPASGYIDDQDKFDAHFFEFSPREAEQLDPQHRFALEVAWQAMENAGYVPDQGNHNIGVFAGANMSTYLIFNLLKQGDEGGSRDAVDLQINIDKDMVATRLSYKFNLQGPSVSLGTACSTSLVAIHLACQSLLNGECKMALAGGSHIATPNTSGHIYREGGFSSPDGYCRAFDAEGKGTVGGNGTCFMLLKPLEDAQQDGDHIYAVIKGSAVNNDGSEKVGYTAPSIEGQTNVVAEAQAVAGIHPDSIRFIEAHGTGTPLGDPIEFAALTRAFQIESEQKQYCAIGSLKTNIGHLGLAAGAAGVIKAALSLKHGVIPESLNYQSPNPKLDIENSPFYVASQLERIESGEDPARAGVSALGIGGTNAHVILEEPPEIESSESRDYQLLLLSAKTPVALDQMTENLAAHIDEQFDSGANDLADAAYSLQVGRKAYEFKRAFVVPTELSRARELISPQTGLTAKSSASDKPIVFMFPGGGTQYVNMARDLYQSEMAFKTLMDDCAVLFRARSGLDIIELLYVDEAQQASQTAVLQRPKYFFAVLFAVEYSLAKLWMSWGVKPDAVVGHSLGEYVAATIAGVFSLADAINLICFRGDLFDKMEKGAMLTVSLPESELQQLLIEGVSIATINDADRCVVAGRLQPIADFEALLIDKAIEYRRLNLDTAGHSSLVEPVLDEFGRFLNQLQFNTPEIGIISNVSGSWAEPQEICTAAYWQKHLRNTVRFSDGINTLAAEGSSIFLEVGPGNALSSFVRAQTNPADGHLLLNSLRHIKEEKNDLSHLLETLGRLCINGVVIDWQAFYSDETRKRLPLPTYPYNRKRYWIEPKKTKSSASEKLPVNEWFWQPSWRLSGLDSSASSFSPLDSAQATTDIETLLVFDDQFSLCRQAAQQLMQKEVEHSINLITVVSGEKFCRLADDSYSLRVGSQQDYQQLLQALTDSNVIPTKILHGWNLDDRQQAVDAASDVPLDYHLSFVYLARAIDSQAWESSVEIIALSNYLEQVIDTDRVNPDKSLIIGPAKVIPYECQNVTLRLIDIDLWGDKPTADQCRCLADKVAEEIAASVPAAEQTVALRQGLRFVKDFNQQPLNQQLQSVSRVKEQGVYLITGGLGGVGMVHAEALAAYKPRLVLMQRGEFPAADQWQALLSDENTDPLLNQQIQSLQRLQQAGAEVMIVQADVCNLASLRAAAESIKQQWGKLDGLIHCAGYGEFVDINETTRDIIADVLAPKVTGSKNLQLVFEPQQLDFVLLCSSLSAVTTGFGLVGYVSACAYLDALAFAHRDDKTFYCSINWDIWNTPQQQAKARRADASPLNSKELKTAILAADGRDVVQRVLASNNSQTIISTRDFRTLQRQNEKLSRALLVGEMADEMAAMDEGDESDLTLYDRPTLSTPYVAPSNERETLLVNIWQETLGISQIGIQDNFFELGGESLLGVKIVVKAKQQGLNIDPKKMFSSPTIQQVIAQLDDQPQLDIDQGLVLGQAACSGIQSAWLNSTCLNGNRGAANHWNLASLFNTELDVDADALALIARRLVNQHDALRTRFVCSAENQWQQQLTDQLPASISQWQDLSALSEADFVSRVSETCEQYQTQLDIERGQVFKLVYLKGAKQSRLLLVVHHLVADAMSLSFIVDDLTQLLNAEADQRANLPLPAKTSAFKDYAEQLYQWSQTEAGKNDGVYWLQTLSDLGDSLAAQLPKDRADGSNLERDSQALSLQLTAAETAALTASDYAPNELLVAAIGHLACGGSAGNSLIDVIGHGRELFIDGLDITRTVGWFGAACLTRLSYSDADLSRQLAEIKSQLHEPPHAGLGLNLLRTYSDDEGVSNSLAALPQARLSVNYLGRLDGLGDAEAGQTNLQAAGEALTNLRSPLNQRQYEHEFIAYIENNALQLHWHYSGSQYQATTIEALAAQLLATLRTLVDSEQSEAQVSEQDLQRAGLVAADVEASYALSPFQTELYGLWRDKNRRLSNITQGVSIVEGQLNGQMLRGVWQALISRHPILRSCFVEAGQPSPQSKPVQLVLKQAQLDLRELDWSDRDEAEQQRLTQQLLVEDRLTPYDLTRAPALRMILVRLTADSSKSLILQSNHQIILDGWSSSLLAQDLAYCVGQLASGGELVALDSDSHYQSYIDWLATQSTAAMQDYWRQQLQGVSCTDLLASMRRADAAANLADQQALQSDSYAEHNGVIDDDLLAGLKQAARSSQTTLNALFQGAWALSLQQLSGSGEIIYGVTLSGRSCELESVTRVIGQCTNSLPLRLSLADARAGGVSRVQWLQQIHQQNLQLQHNNLLSLSEVKQLAGLSATDPLYQSNVIFENIPMPGDDGPGDDGPEDEGSSDRPQPLSVSEGYWTDGWQFPLRLFVVPEGEGIWIRLAFDRLELQAEEVESLGARLLQNLQALAADVEGDMAPLLNQ